MDNTPKQKAVTREEIHDIVVADEGGVELRELALRLLAERDEALRLKDAAVKVGSDFETAWKELNIEIVNERRWKEAYRQIAIDLRAKWGGWVSRYKNGINWEKKKLRTLPSGSWRRGSELPPLH